MNIHKELKVLNHKYGNNPATKKCFFDTLKLFAAYQEIVFKRFEAIKEKEAENG